MLHDTHPGQIAFPAEIICHILCFLSTREIIRLRRISKLFRDLTCDPALWKTLYANARLPRPPGPFPSQSTQFLERTLVQSERLALTWASQPIKVTSRDLVRTQLSASPPQWCVLCGRWFIWCETTQILCRDLDAGRLQVLWDGYAQISHFCACAVTSVDGQRVYILLHGKQPDQLQGELTKMLEFEVDDHSCSFSVPVSLDIPLQPGGPPFSISGQWPFLCIRGPVWTLVWDVHTRIFYELPPFSSTLGTVNGSSTQLRMVFPQLVLSRTHIIAVYRWYGLDAMTIILQAFVVPDLPHSARDGICELCLTHEASMDHFPSPMCLIRGSVFNPVTRATTLRILNHFESRDHTEYACIDLTLPELSSGNVLPMYVHVQQLFTFDGGVWNLTASSDDGHLRGLCGVVTAEDPQAHFVRKFTVDASQERCIAMLGQACPMEPAFAQDRRAFDGIRGRICYIKRGDLAVVDFQ